MKKNEKRNGWYSKSTCSSSCIRKKWINGLIQFALIALIVLVPALSHAGPTIQIKPNTKKHRWYGMGCGVSLYHGHLNSLNSSNYQIACDWLFTDLNMEWVRASCKGKAELTNDDDNPYTQNWDAFDIKSTGRSKIIREAIARNPNTKIMAYTGNFPDFLKIIDSNGKTTGLNYSYPNFYAEIAEWIYVHLVHYKTVEGLDIGAIDILNEPDIKSWISKSDGHNLYKNLVNELRDMVNGNSYGVQMPLVVGPSTCTVNPAKSWLDYLRVRPDSWNNIDAFTLHNYGGGDKENLSNYQYIKSRIGSRYFFQNEMHVRGTDSFAAALSLGHTMSVAIHGGVNTYHYFQVNYPKYHKGGLIQTPWNGTPKRNDWYYTFKHFSFTPRNAWVCGRSLNGIPSDFHIVTFQSGGKCYLVVTNEGTSHKQYTISVKNNYVSRVIDYASNSSGKRCELNSDKTYSTPVSQFKTWISPKTIRTFVIHYTSTKSAAASIASIENNNEAGGFILSQNYPNPFNSATSFDITVPEQSQVSVQIYNISGQLVNTVVNKTYNPGNYTLTWDGKNTNGQASPSGIYYCRMAAGDFIRTEKMIIK